jgi:hypothetical protein
VDSERLVAHESVTPLRVWRLQRKREEKRTEGDSAVEAMYEGERAVR